MKCGIVNWGHNLKFHFRCHVSGSAHQTQLHLVCLIIDRYPPLFIKKCDTALFLCKRGQKKSLKCPTETAGWWIRISFMRCQKWFGYYLERVGNRISRQDCHMPALRTTSTRPVIVQVPGPSQWSLEVKPMPSQYAEDSDACWWSICRVIVVRIQFLVERKPVSFPV